MAAPTSNEKLTTPLANGGPSTHGSLAFASVPHPHGPLFVAHQIGTLGNRDPGLDASPIAGGSERRHTLGNECVDAIAVVTEHLIGASP